MSNPLASVLAPQAKQVVDNMFNPKPLEQHGVSTATNECQAASNRPLEHVIPPIALELGNGHEQVLKNEEFLRIEEEKFEAEKAETRQRIVDELTPEELISSIKNTFGPRDRPELVVPNLEEFLKGRAKEAINSGLRRGVRIFRQADGQRVLFWQGKTISSAAEFVKRKGLLKGFVKEEDGDVNILLIAGYIWEYWYHR